MDIIKLKQAIEKVNSFEFYSSANKNNSGWEGNGFGIVNSYWKNENKLIFEEKGYFIDKYKSKIKCGNIYQWTFDIPRNSISLEYFQFGKDSSLFLFELTILSDDICQLAYSNGCIEEQYEVNMNIDSHCISMNWKIENNSLHNKLDYTYNF